MFEVDSALTVREVNAELGVLRWLVGRLEPAAVALPDAAPMWRALDAIERLAAGAKTLLAARVDESGVAGGAGDTGTAEYLARRSGTSSAAAKQGLETSRRLSKLTHTRDALRRGEQSRQQVDEIADAADKNPGAEVGLLEIAKRSSLGELRQECARRRAEADPDPDATRRRLHRGRRLRRWTDAEGAWNLQARGTPEDGSRFNAVLDRIRDELFAQARREGRREDPDCYAFDALIELARRHGTRRRTPAPAGSAVKLAPGGTSRTGIPAPASPHRSRRLPGVGRRASPPLPVRPRWATVSSRFILIRFPATIPSRRHPPTPSQLSALQRAGRRTRPIWHCSESTWRRWCAGGSTRATCARSPAWGPCRSRRPGRCWANPCSSSSSRPASTSST